MFSVTVPPRLAKKALFLKILKAVQRKGRSDRRLGILDRLYHNDAPDLQWQSLELDCAAYGIVPNRFTPRTIRFTPIGSSVKVDIFSFVSSYPHLRKAG